MFCVVAVVRVRPIELQSALWPDWDETPTRHFAMQTGMCMKSQGRGGSHVCQTCDVRGGLPVV